MARRSSRFRPFVRAATTGSFATGDLVFDKAGNLYGATQFGGGQGTTCDILYGGNCGTIFELSPPRTKGGEWTETVLHSFAGGTDGAAPNGGLVIDNNGDLYGTTSMGGNQLCNFGNGNVGCGIVFELARLTTGNGLWESEVLHRFTGGSDGANPSAGLTFHGSGLFGVTAGGGTKQDGVVFWISKRRDGGWTGRVIHNFIDNAHGREPSGPVRFDSSGNLYGPAGWGQYFAGVVYRMSPKAGDSPWSYSLPYEFKGSPDGANPYAGLILDNAGNMYGTTGNGGTAQTCQGGCGTVFEIAQ